jgi:hypothetical protein
MALATKSIKIELGPHCYSGVFREGEYPKELVRRPIGESSNTQ